ncbi:MAG: LytR/AlgR family response regulator transcription factor [Candidatus Kapaibacteriota bacterium]|jgi:two-component system LytT family response regulator
MTNAAMTKHLIKTLIVDDEDLAREKIRHFLGDDEECLVLADCANGYKAVESVCERLPDVIFLDIQMPELDGFETLRMIRDSLDEEAVMPLVVFITAFDHYALKAFEAHAVDYLLKPFDYERFQAMFARVKEQIRARQAHSSQESLLREIRELQSQRALKYPVRYAFKTRGRIYFVDVEDVDWIEADRNYALFHVSGLTHVLRTAFGELAEQLDPVRFLRIHRSAIVRKSGIQEIRKRSERSYQIVLRNGKELDIGVGYRDSVFAALGLVSPED